MAKDNSVLESEDKFDLTSMIDVVFLLLIYFMYLPIQQEADLMFSLPAYSAPSENVALPSEQVVEINPDGSITLNGAPVDHPGDIEFDELASTLRRLKLSADRSGYRDDCHDISGCRLSAPGVNIGSRRMREGRNKTGIVFGS